eukprot:6483987-Amphidinium_carterae.1
MAVLAPFGSSRKQNSFTVAANLLIMLAPQETKFVPAGKRRQVKIASRMSARRQKETNENRQQNDL